MKKYGFIIAVLLLSLAVGLVSGCSEEIHADVFLNGTNASVFTYGTQDILVQIPAETVSEYKVGFTLKISEADIALPPQLEGKTLKLERLSDTGIVLHLSGELTYDMGNLDVLTCTAVVKESAFTVAGITGLLSVSVEKPSLALTEFGGNETAGVATYRMLIEPRGVDIKNVKCHLKNGEAENISVKVEDGKLRITVEKCTKADAAAQIVLVFEEGSFDAEKEIGFVIPRLGETVMGRRVYF